MMPPTVQHFEAYFWSRVNKNGPTTRPELGPCWPWTGATNGRYGHLRHKGKNLRAHRVAYRLTKGVDTPLVRHLCDNTLCCRGEHLEAGTQHDNIQDAKRRGRLSPPPVGKRRLVSRELVRSLRDRGLRAVEIARRLRVSESCVYLNLKEVSR